MMSRLYFIALVPPEPVLSEVLEFKRLMAAKYNATHSLKTPPHITMYKPFKWDEDREEVLALSLEDFSSDQIALEMKLDGFGCFAPGVVFVEPLQNIALKEMFSELLKFLEINLNIYDQTFAKRGFNPHMSIAHRDLDKKLFPEAWNEFKNKEYHRSFRFEKLSLLKHNGSSWDVNEEFRFG